MYSRLIDLPEFKSGKLVRVAEAAQVNLLFLTALGKVAEYNLVHRNFVDNQHPLVKVAALMTSMYQPDMEEFLDVIYEEQLGMERIFGLVSASNPHGAMHPIGLYNKHCPATYLSTMEYFDYEAGHSDIVPIKVISHPFTDLSMGLANGKYYSQSKETGLCTFLFDLGKFAFLLHLWLSGIMKKGAAPNPDNMAQFVYMVILPRILNSHINICMLNRLRISYIGGKVSQHYTVYPIGGTDLTSKVDGVIKQYLKLLDQSKLTHDGIVASLPQLSRQTMQETLYIPSVRVNDNNAWALMVSRLDLYLFIFRLASQEMRPKAGFLRSLQDLLKKALDEIALGKQGHQRMPPSVTNKLDQLKIFLDD